MYLGVFKKITNTLSLLLLQGNNVGRLDLQGPEWKGRWGSPEKTEDVQARNAARVQGGHLGKITRLSGVVEGREEQPGVPRLRSRLAKWARVLVMSRRPSSSQYRNLIRIT